MAKLEREARARPPQHDTRHARAGLENRVREMEGDVRRLSEEAEVPPHPPSHLWTKNMGGGGVEASGQLGQVETQVWEMEGCVLRLTEEAEVFPDSRAPSPFKSQTVRVFNGEKTREPWNPEP